MSQNELIHTKQEIARAAASHAMMKHMFGEKGNKFRKPEYGVGKNITNSLVLEKAAQKILSDPEGQYIKTNNGRSLFFSPKTNLFLAYNQRQLDKSTIYPPDPDKSFEVFVYNEKEKGKVENTAVIQKGGYDQAFTKEQRTQALERVKEQKAEEKSLADKVKLYRSRLYRKTPQNLPDKSRDKGKGFEIGD